MDLLCEKYRPKNIDSLIAPPELIGQLTSVVESGNIPNMLFYGSSGVGKTSAARAICDQINASVMMINGSDERNIDVLRGKITQFATTVSLDGSQKVVIIDEADYLNAQSTQPALRNFMEEYSGNCRFIMTCNFPKRIIESLHSRCSTYDFGIANKDLQALCAQMLKRCKWILEQEGVTYDVQDVAHIILKQAPDWRRILNTIQKHVSIGQLIVPEKLDDDGGVVADLIKFIKADDFSKVRGWIARNTDIDNAAVFRALYEHLAPQAVDEPNLAQMILILADYGYKDAFVVDREVNLAACAVQIMSQIKFKS